GAPAGQQKALVGCEVSPHTSPGNSLKQNAPVLGLTHRSPAKRPSRQLAPQQSAALSQHWPRASLAPPQHTAPSEQVCSQKAWSAFATPGPPAHGTGQQDVPFVQAVLQSNIALWQPAAASR